MSKQLIYDIPTRLFHWLFVGLFSFAFIVAQTADDESVIFTYHMLAGMMLGFIVLLRILWGFVGSKHARFSSFPLHPRDLANYFLGILSGEKRRWPGHNPASSWAALTMMALALGLAITGYFMSTGSKETFEDVHELLANSFLLIAILHVAGVLLHGLRFQDGLALSMVHGAKPDVFKVEGIRSSRPVIGMIFVAIVSSFAITLIKNFDSQKQSLNFFGTTLQLGENEDHSESRSFENRENSKSTESEEDDD